MSYFPVIAAVYLVQIQSTTSLPDPSALMDEVRAHQQAMSLVRENYTFHRIRQVDQVDSSGSVKKTLIEEREIFFINGHSVARLLKKDGDPLPAPQEKAEQERVRKLTEKHMKEPPTTGKTGVNLVSMVLAVARVSNLRRVELNGRSTFQFDFEGDRNAEAHGLESNAAKKLAGKIWIDEADRQLARVEMEFYDTFRIAGGLLAAIQKGTTMKVDQSPIGEGLWMPTLNEQHVNLRVVAKGLHENITVKSFDFKKFNVEAAVTKP